MNNTKKMNNSQMDGWNNLYRKGFRGRYPSEDLIRFIQRNFPARESRGSLRILDFGSGTGRHIIYLAKEGFNVFGVETAKSGINLTKKWLKLEKLHATLKVINGPKLPFPDEYFDAVIECAALQHNRNSEIESIISEIYRVLKPGGKVFSFCKSTKDALYNEGVEIEEKTFYLREGADTNTLISFFTKKKITSLWSKFVNIGIEYSERTIDNMKRRVSHYVVSAEKELTC